MSRVLAVAKREFAACFTSPIANVFILAFAGASAFTFFNLAGFFSRGIADIRGLLEAIPALMLILVPALTMRLWAEEQKSGTFEILFTLPIRKAELVAGKFLATLSLLVVALALTLPLAFTTAYLGDLDWGPVAGGFLGAVLLGAAYLAVGQFVSALTENQILAFITALLICTAFYGVGTEVFAGLFPDAVAAMLRAVGSGSRFESISRGVIDLRDVWYYLSICLTFLVATVCALEVKRAPRESGAVRARNRRITLLALLVAANLFATNLLVSGLTSARVDLTADRRFTMSETTRNVLESLDEPVTVVGYFSERTHPKLAPLVPEIRDLLAEYAATSSGRFRYQILNPEKDEAVQSDAVERFGVKSRPFQFASKYESSLVNSWFAIVVRYGDVYQKYEVGDLIEVVPAGDGEVDVRLRNLEYDLTRAVRKLSTEARAESDLLQTFERPVKLTALMTPATLPSRLAGIPRIVRDAAIELQARSGGKFTFEEITPETSAAAIATNLRRWGTSAMRSGYPESGEPFYLYALLQVGDQVEQIPISNEQLTKEGFQKAIQSGLRRNAPGFVQTIGVFSPDPAISREMLAQFGVDRKVPNMRLPEYEAVRSILSREYVVRDVNLRTTEMVPEAVDVLLVIEPAGLTDQEVWKLDQFLMRGGKVVICAGAFDPELGEQFGIKPVATGLEAWLGHFGVEIGKTLVLDARNQPLPIPQITQGLSGPRESWVLAPYPYLLRVELDGFANRDVSGQLRSIGLYWPSPVFARPSANVEGSVIPILQSSEASWTSDDLSGVRRPTYEVPKQTSPQPLAVAIDGRFRSYWADRPPPQQIGDPALLPIRSVSSQSPQTRLVVIGDSVFLSDFVARAFGSTLAGFFTENLRFVQNVIDWTTVEGDMVAIRSRRSQTSRLPEISRRKQVAFEAANYVFPLFVILVITVVRASRRRRATPFTLEEGE